IDEVHMLSTSAFNAFLKTLEEPPPHAIFILATTEKQKIIPTILSRCQIFDFQRITIDDISGRLRYVADQEGVEAEQEALNVIAQKADGAMRDALTIFDQIVSFSGRQITYRNVIENLNVLDHEYYLRITEAFNKVDVSASLLIFNEILEKGFDGHNFIAGLGSHFRNLLVAGDKTTINLIEVGSKVRERYISQRAGCSLGFLYKGLEILSNCDIYYKTSRNQRLHVELALIRLCNISGKAVEAVEASEVDKAVTTPKEKTKTETKTETPDPEKEKSPDIVKQPSSADKVSTTVKKVISIKDTLANGNNSSDNIEEDNSSDYESDKEIISDAEFSLDDLVTAWNKFGVKIKDRSPRMSSIIQAMNPLLGDDNKIELHLKTEDQKGYFDKNFKADMIEYLKDELKNRNISFDTVVVEGDDNSVPYTMEQKYDHLRKKNPLVDKLKKDFLLDYD
ncbi:MAG: DNA polymerase III subunit gamma/tau, partial [Bacteroidales bacterium]|nr:DNA polymerase III subunit gamma/tau [Bacteroidales bacterium]